MIRVKNWLLLAIFLPLVGCQNLPDIQNNLQSFRSNLTLKSHVKEVGGVIFEVKACTLSETRVISCRLVVMSKFQDRNVDLYAGGHVKVQDDAGNSYPVNRIGFGRNSKALNGSSMLIADTPYEVTLEVDNVSTQATKVRAINVTRADVKGADGRIQIYAKFVFTRPPMTTSLQAMKPRQKLTKKTQVKPHKFAPAKLFTPINVVNPSFETSAPFAVFSVGGNFKTSVTGWRATQVSGTFSPSTPGNSFGFDVFTQKVPDGVNTVFSLGNGEVSQVLTVSLKEKTTYKLEVDVGDRSFMNLPDSYSAQLRAGGVVLASGTVTPANGTFTTLSLKYTSKTGDPFGAPLEVSLVTKHKSSDPNGVQINWDNVRIFSKPR